MAIESELPPRTETEPDAKGVKTVVEWRFNENNDKVKITKKIRVVRKTVRTSRRVAERRNNWPKFGACAGMPPGPESNVTIMANDEVNIEHPDEEQIKKESVDLEKGSVVVCRVCGMTGDHWTLQCPYKDSKGVKPPTAEEAAMEEAAATGKPGKYVPPGKRAGAEGASAEGGSSSFRGGDDRDAATLRVTNVSDDTSEKDLQDLFGRFGRIARVFLARDRETKVSRGFAFVSFHRREDAQRAMDGLQGYGYGYLILKIEWARPSAPKNDQREDPSAKYRTGYGRALPQDVQKK